MTAAVFVDTNVLVYAIDQGDPNKQQRARAWSAYLLSEDLQADQDLDGVLVVNPFVREPGSIA